MTSPITIVGAGIGGLVLARVLYVLGVHAVVYEAEPAAGSRSQGGQLDIHVETGQRALEIAGLTAEFHAIVNPGAAASRVLDKCGTVLHEEPDGSLGGRPEVLRGELRRILLEAIPSDTVRWGSKVAGVRPLGGGRHEPSFTDGTTVTTDDLVGADGAWSKIRPLVSDVRPTYDGMTFVETYLYDADARHPAAAAAVGPGALYALAPDHGIFAHREPHGVLHAYVSLNRPEAWAAGIDVTDRATATARLAAEFDRWAPELRALITESDTMPIPRPIHALPDGHRWDHVPGVTLLGDAAHLTGPNGEGANLAMIDGAELGMATAAHSDELDAALVEYEAAMFPRSAASAVEGRVVTDLLLGPKGPRGLVDFFVAAGAAPAPPH